MLSPPKNVRTSKQTEQYVKNYRIPNLQIHQLFTFQHIQKLLQQQQKHLSKFRLTQKTNEYTQHYRYQSEIQKGLSLPFSQRTAKIIKTTKYQIRDYDCFSVKKNLDKTQNNLQEKQQKSQQYQMIKRDIESMISLFAMYSEIAYYEKGQIIDVTGLKMQKIRILLHGEVGIYEPINKTSLINCILKIKQKQNQNLPYLTILYNDVVAKISKRLSSPIKTRLETRQKRDRQSDGKEKAQIDEDLVSRMLGQFDSHNLSNQICQQILSLSEIITPITPHKNTQILSGQGILLVPQSQSSSIISQVFYPQTPFTAICLSSQAAFIELDFAIFREILWLINNDEEKHYISCLMTKFESLSYFEAQKYLKKKENIIDYIESKNRNLYLKDESSKVKAPSKDYDQIRNEIQSGISSPIYNQEENLTIEERREFRFLNKLQSLQNESSSLYFTIPYTKTPYLIVEGEVVIVINKVKQQKLIDEKYSLPRKSYIRQELLKLYENDTFGVQAIGEESQYSLRYEVRKDSKILRMSKKILKEQVRIIPEFQEEFNRFKFKRDRRLQEILGKLSKHIEKNVIKKYQEHQNYNQKEKYKKEKKNMEIIHFQKEDNVLKTQSQAQLTPNNKNTVNSTHNQIKSSSFSLPNIPKSHLKKSVAQFSDNFSSKSKPLALTERKKYEQESPYLSKIHHVEYIGNKEYSQVKKQIIEKLSLKERQRYSAHHQKRLTVELLKQFDLVGFSQDGIDLSSKNGGKYAFVEMRDPVTGVLLRRRAIPSIQNIQGSKNRQNIERAIMRKIGLLSEVDKVKHNEKVVKSRRSQVKFENLDEVKREQQRRLTKFSKSLPRLNNFYSKQANIQYKNKNPGKMMV